MGKRSVIILSAIALLAACGDDDEPQDNERDGSVFDGGRADGGDAGRDAQSSADVQVPPVDSSVPTDSGRPDTGVPTTNLDAGLDAQVIDAGPPDTGVPQDASLPLAAWYKFDETSGTTADDSTAQFADAVLVNGASFVTGKRGNAVDLAGGVSTGNNNFVRLPANILAECDDTTIALWIKLGTVTNWSRILDYDGKVDGFIYFTPAEDFGGAPHLRFNIFQFISDNNPANDQLVRAPYPQGTTLVGAWHHIAFTLTGDTGRLYFDGVQLASNAMTKKPSDITVGQTGEAVLGKSLIFPDPYLDATIDDLRIACTAYTAQQIAALAAP